MKPAGALLRQRSGAFLEVAWWRPSSVSAGTLTLIVSGGWHQRGLFPRVVYRRRLFPRGRRRGLLFHGVWHRGRLFAGVMHRRWLFPRVMHRRWLFP